jgi:C-terminal processing protease CtpA/Prc
MTRPFARPLLTLLAAVGLLAACGGDEQADQCGPDAEKRALAELVYQWYLYPETLPPAVDTSKFATSADLLKFMTDPARAANLDRGWSYTTTITQARTTFEEGTSVGFGIGNLVRGTQLFVSQVFSSSPAADAGFVRGDEILRIGETPETLAPVADAIAADAANHTNTLGAMFGPSAEGVIRSVEVKTGAGATVRTMTKRVFGLDPVPAVEGTQRWKIVDRPGKKLGYVALRTFIAPADAPLDEAFAAFKAAGVTDVVVDLRYNGGGLVSTGEHLANLLGGGLGGKIMMETTYRPERALSNDRIDHFAELANALAPAHVAFITTGSSASASEMVPNVLEPYVPLALVGARTYGKPVGQNGFRLRNCEAAVYLVSFRLQNAQGDAGYYQGLPDAPIQGSPAFSGPLCEAPDDLTHALGDPAEESTAAALAWLETGTCPPPAAPPAAKPGVSGALRTRTAPDRYPEAPAPTDAHRQVRGLF